MADFETNINEEEVKQTKPKKKHVVGKIILILLFCVLIGFPAYYGGKQLIHKYTPAYAEGGIGGLANAVGNDITDNNDPSIAEDDSSAAETPVDKEIPKDEAKPASSPVLAEKKDTTSTTALSEEEIYENNVDSVVSISTMLEGYNYFGQKVQGAASGSGFLISADGYILTNYHVIEDAKSITVKTYSGDEYEATVRGYDKSNDIAVLKIDATDIHPVVLGDSDVLKAGQHVVAIGNALGQYGFSITEGIISGLARDVKVDTNLTMSLIQTDCAINSGNSGGPLFNMSGEVVGITNAKLSSSGSGASVDNIGFAIPINSVYEIVLNIIDNGSTANYADTKTPFLGISGADISDETKAVTGLTGGAMVAYVYDGSAAADAGIQVNDIILSVDGKSVADFAELKSIISEYAVGDKVEFEIYRSGATITVKTVLTAKSDVDTTVTESTVPENNQNNQNSQNGQPNNIPGNSTPGSNGSNNFGGFDSFEDLYNYMYGMNNRP